MDETSYEYQKLQERNCISRTCGEMDEGSMRNAIFLLMTSMIGLGYNFIPLTLNVSGFIPALASLIVFGCIFGGFYYLIFYSCNVFMTYDYIQIISTLYGRFWRRMTEFILCLTCFGITVCYMTYFILIVVNLMINAKVIEQKNFRLASIITLVTSSLIIWIPITLGRFKNFQKYMSRITLLTIVYIVAYLCYMASYFYFAHKDIKRDLKDYDIDWDILDSFVIYSFAFNGSYFIPSISKGLAFQSQRRLTKVLARGFGLTGLLYLAILVASFVAYRRKGSFAYGYPVWLKLQEYPSAVPCYFALILLAVALFFAVPYNMKTFLSTLEQAIAGEIPHPSKFPFVLAILIVYGLAIVLSYNVKTLQATMSILVGVLIPYMSFCLPAMLYWKASDVKGTRYIVAAISAILCSLSLFLILNFFYSNLDI